MVKPDPTGTMASPENHLQFVAAIAEREVLRYTPAGIPMVSARLQHRSKQLEAGIERIVEFDIAALAAGEISGRFDQAALGGMFHFTGFLARRSRNSKGLVFHIADFEVTDFESTTI
jgi:primosomal replication protein N